MLKFETPISPKIPTFRAPEIDTEGISEAARLHAEREAWQDEQTTLSLEVQQSMAARLEMSRPLHSVRTFCESSVSI